MRLLISLALVAYVLAAPVQQEKEVDKRRESTKETIELEDTLKRLAGEDKKYFSNPMARPMPQVDGLEEKAAGSGDVEDQAAKSEPVALKPLEEQLKVVEETSKEQPLQGGPPQEQSSQEQMQEMPQEQPQEEEAELEAEAAEAEPAADEALEDEIEAAHHPVPGPYGPGLESSHPGSSVEYEPQYTGEEANDLHEEEEEEEEPQEEQYFLDHVMETLRRHPELLSELMNQGSQDILDTENDIEGAVDKRGSPDLDERDLATLADYEDRVSAIQAELAAIRAQSDPQFAAAYHKSLANAENEQNYLGDQESHIVAKKNSLHGDNSNMAIPKEYVEDSIESLNRYFDKYADDERADVPIM